MAWVLLFFEIYFLLVLKSDFPPNFEIYLVSICMVITLLSYYTFIRNGEYGEIYKRYQYLNISRKTNVLVVLFYILFPSVVFVFLALIHHYK